MITLDDVRAVARSLPGVAEGTSYGTPAFRARRKFLARVSDDGEALVLKVGELEQRFLIDAEPETYYITPHYAGSSLVLVRFAQIERAAFEDLFVRSWRLVALKRDLATYTQHLKGSTDDHPSS